MAGSFINPHFYLNQTYEYAEQELKKAGIYKIAQIREGERLPTYDEYTVYVIVTDGIITKIARYPKSN